MKSGIIRILHVIGVMDRGGAEAMIMNLYRKIDRNRIQFDFVVHTTDKGLYDSEIRELGGHIYHCPRYKVLNHVKYVSWWRKFLLSHRQQYGIVHGHIGSTAAIYLAIAKKNGLTTIAHSHNTYGALTPREAVYRILSYKTRFIADYFFACSRQAGIDRYGKKIMLDQTKFKVVPNAIDTAAFAYNPEERFSYREKMGIPGNTLLVGHVGRFFEVKNHFFILKVFHALLQTGIQASLLLVGDGPLRPETEKQVAILGIKDSVIFTGVRTDVNRLVQAMDVMLFPSLFEGLPVTLVEAQTSGLPIIMSEHVPTEAILVDDLVMVESLKSPVEKWIQDIRTVIGQERRNRQKEIVEKGFDIETTAKWLEGFYIDRHKR